MWLKLNEAHHSTFNEKISRLNERDKWKFITVIWTESIILLFLSENKDISVQLVNVMNNDLAPPKIKYQTWKDD